MGLWCPEVPLCWCVSTQGGRPQVSFTQVGIGQERVGNGDVFPSIPTLHVFLPFLQLVLILSWVGPLRAQTMKHGSQSRLGKQDDHPNTESPDWSFSHHHTLFHPQVGISPEHRKAAYAALPDADRAAPHHVIRRKGWCLTDCTDARLWLDFFGFNYYSTAIFFFQSWVRCFGANILIFFFEFSGFQLLNHL